MSAFLVQFFQEALKDKFPKFAYWLFYSEMTVSIVIGLPLLFFELPEKIVGGVFLLYAAFNWICACNYGRKRALEQKLSWEPSRFDRAVAIYLNLGVGFLGGLLVYFVNNSWIAIVAGLALIVISLLNLFKLCSGDWVDNP